MDCIKCGWDGGEGVYLEAEDGCSLNDAGRLLLMDLSREGNLSGRGKLSTRGCVDPLVWTVLGPDGVDQKIGVDPLVWNLWCGLY